MDYQAVADNVILGKDVRLGRFINLDNHPRSVNAQGNLESEKDWVDRFVNTKIGNNVSIGSGTTILGGISVDNGAMIGAGSMVTKNIPGGEIWAGNPAKFMRKL